MDKSCPVASVEECLQYLSRNAWQLKLLAPESKVTVSAHMLRSFFYHIYAGYAGQGGEILEPLSLRHSPETGSLPSHDTPQTAETPPQGT